MNSWDARGARMDHLYATLTSDERREWNKALEQCGSNPPWDTYVAVPARLLKRIEALAQPLDERLALANELDGYAISLSPHYSTFPWGTVRRAAELLRLAARASGTPPVAVDPVDGVGQKDATRAKSVSLKQQRKAVFK